MMEHSKSNRAAGYSNAEKDKLRDDANAEKNTSGITNHRKAAEHFSLAASFHYEAARYHEEGNPERAHGSALLAIGHSSLAHKYQTEDTRQHALNS